MTDVYPCNSKQQPIFNEDFDEEIDLVLVSKEKEKYPLNNYFSFIWNPNLVREKWLILSVGD